MIYCCQTIEQNYKMYSVTFEGNMYIGNSIGVAIKYSILSHQQAVLKYFNKSWEIENIEKKENIYVNGMVANNQKLKYGDAIFILGLKIVVLKDLVVVNEIVSDITMNNS